MTSHFEYRMEDGGNKDAIDTIHLFPPCADFGRRHSDEGPHAAYASTHPLAIRVRDAYVRISANSHTQPLIRVRLRGRLADILIYSAYLHTHMHAEDNPPIIKVYTGSVASQRGNIEYTAMHGANTCGCMTSEWEYRCFFLFFSRTTNPRLIRVAPDSFQRTQ